MGEVGGRRDLDAGRPARGRSAALLAVTVVVCVAAAAAVVHVKGLQQTDPGRVEAVLRSSWAMPALFGANVLSCATLFMPVPGLMMSASAGVFWAGWLVGLVAGLGQTVGELTGYFARLGGRGVVGQGRRFDRATRWLGHNQTVGSVFLFMMAALPNPVFDASGVAAGALRFPLWRFLASVAPGKIVKNVAVAYLGRSLAAGLVGL